MMKWKYICELIDFNFNKKQKFSKKYCDGRTYADFCTSVTQISKISNRGN